MNLSERLKPEYKTKLDLVNFKFPSLVGFITDNLESYSYVRDLPYGIVSDLKFLLETTESPYELFNEL